MNNVAENLERYYRSFLDWDGDWGFFLGLTDYVQFVLEVEQASQLIGELARQKSEDNEALVRYEKQALIEIRQAAKTLFARIEKQNVSVDGLETVIKQYHNCDAGRVAGSQSPAQILFEALSDVIATLSLNGQADIVKGYVRENERYPAMGEAIFSKAINLRQEAEQTLAQKKKTSVWNAWDHLRTVHLLITQGDAYGKELQRESLKGGGDVPKQWALLNYMGYHGEMEKVEQGEHSTFFRRQDYRLYASRFHNWLLTQLSVEPEGSKKKANLSTSLPSGLIWSHVEIELTSQDYVTVRIKGREPKTIHYSELGLADRRKSGEPTKLWSVLKGFAGCHGRIDWRDSFSEKLKQTLSKDIERLGKALSAFFGIKGTPFRWDKRESAYLCQFPISDISGGKATGGVVPSATKFRPVDDEKSE